MKNLLKETLKLRHSHIKDNSDIMSDIRFKSSLSIEEIENNFKDIDLFSGIMEGLEEALAYEKGKASAETFVRKQSLH